MLAGIFFQAGMEPDYVMRHAIGTLETALAVRHFARA
jgi:hypothetical protein